MQKTCAAGGAAPTLGKHSDSIRSKPRATVSKAKSKANAKRQRQALKPIPKFFVWFGTATAMVVLLTALVYSLFRQGEEADALRTHTYVVMNAADELLSAMKDAETGERGYLLTGDEAFLAPYLVVHSTLLADLAQLGQLTRDNPEQQQRIPVLHQLAQAKLKLLQEAIEARRHGTMAQAAETIRCGPCLQLMTDFRHEMQAFIRVEQDLLVQRNAHFEAVRQQLLMSIAALGSLALLSAAGASIVIYRETQASLAVQQHHSELLAGKNATLEALTLQLREDDVKLVAQHQKALDSRDRMVLIEKMSSLGTMVGGVAHEINNPLMGVMNYVEFARDKATDAKSVEVLNNALHEINRIKKIVQNMLVFVRVANAATGPTEVSEAVTQTLTLLEGEFRKASMQMVLALPPHLPPVHCNAGSLQQVLVNLLLNARDAVAAQPEKCITIRADHLDGKVVILVCDSGLGVPEEVRQQLFTPFFTTKPVGKGTGLGLAVSRQLMEQAGGTLSLADEPGFGACFRIELGVA
jgi:C4-dicarboxylate-specific signal transduction histidine kinase